MLNSPPLMERLGHPIPAAYRALLARLGPGKQAQTEIYHPGDIAGLYEHHFQTPGQLFQVYFPFGCDNHTQEIWLIRVEDQAMAAIGYETHPDDYPQERWLPPAQWLSEHELK